MGAPFGGKIGSIDPLYPLYFGSLLLLLGSLIAVLMFKERKLDSRPTSFIDSLTLLREEKRIFIPYGFSFVEWFTVGFFVGVFPLMLAIKYGLGPGIIGMYMAAFLIPFALLQYPFGAMSDKIGEFHHCPIGQQGGSQPCRFV